MTARPPLRVAVWLMERCRVDDAVIGDLIELDHTHRSSRRLWREALMAIGRSTAARVGHDAPQTVRRVATAAGVVWVLSYTAAGHQPVDLGSVLRVEHVSTGWLDAAADGRTRVVPSVAFELKNVGSAPLAPVQVNVVFRRASDAHDWSDAFRRAATRRQPLAPGASTGPITVESPAGYTGSDPGIRLLDNTQFVDAAVTIYARQGSEGWMSLGSYPVERVLVGPSGASR